MMHGLTNFKFKRFFSSVEGPDRLWGPSSIIFIGNRGSSPGKDGQDVMSTGHLRLMPTL